MSQLNQKPEKNRKEQEQNVTGQEDKIDERRYKVYLMDLQGFSNNEIAKQLGTSLSTIEKDLHNMRNYCTKWYQEVINTDRNKSYLDSCTQIDLVQDELWRMYREQKDTNAKKRLLDSIVSNSIKKKNVIRPRMNIKI